MHRNIIKALLLLLCNGVIVAASNTAVQTQMYDPQKATMLDVLLNTTTEIQLPKAETIESIECGDAVAWQISVAESLGNTVFVKPTLDHSSTNLIIATDEHHYLLHLLSHAHAPDGVSYPYALRFAMPAVLPKRRLIKHYYKNQRYSYHGPHWLKPISAFDNGKQTTLCFMSNRPLPAVFEVIDAKGRERMVNSRYLDRCAVIETVAAQLSLRYSSGAVASVFNRQAIMRRAIRSGQ